MDSSSNRVIMEKGTEKGTVIVSNVQGKKGKVFKYKSEIDSSMVDNWEELVVSKHIKVTTEAEIKARAKVVADAKASTEANKKAKAEANKK